MTEKEFLIYILSIGLNIVGVFVTYIILGSICRGDFQSFDEAQKRKRRR